MKFKCGIIGLPNVGKSALFNILTHSSVKSENFPFCTIQANKGFVSITDNRLLQLSELLKISNVVPGYIEVIDIAGLIQGASQGEGLGNSFLHDISETDILCHVVRCFDIPDIYHVHSEIDPKKDIAIIHNELILSDIALCERILLSYEKNIRYNDNCDVKVLKILKKCLMHLHNGGMLHRLTLHSEEKFIIKSYNFLTCKPIIYVANIDINDYHINNRYLLELSDIAINENIPYVSMCFLFQDTFERFKGRDEAPSPHVMSSSNFKERYKLFELIDTIYKVLQLKTFFTVNMREIRAWIVSEHTVAIEAANMIHSDFKKKFIRAEVVKYNDFMGHQGWKKSKKFGKVRTEGKNYLIQDGDVLHFLI